MQLYYSAGLCAFSATLSFTRKTLIYISVCHSMTKSSTRPTWQDACISNYLSASLASVFFWLPTGSSVNLHIWLAVSCLLCVCFGIPCLLALQPCFSVFLFFYVSLSLSPPLCPPVCLPLCLANHRDWHLTLQQNHVTEVCNGLVWRSLKHDWQDKQVTCFGGINAVRATAPPITKLSPKKVV